MAAVLAGQLGVCGALILPLCGVRLAPELDQVVHPVVVSRVEG